MAKKVEKTYTQAEVDELVRKALSQITINQEVKKVTLLFIGAIARGTTVALGRLGSINRAGGMITVPKDLFLSSLGLPVVDALLRKRELIVIDGLDDDERERYELDYKDGELLSQKVFFKLFDLPYDEIIKIFKELCDNHKEVVAKMYLTAYFETHDNRVNIETVEKLNELSKSSKKGGLFKPILDDYYGKKIAE